FLYDQRQFVAEALNDLLRFAPECSNKPKMLRKGPPTSLPILRQGFRAQPLRSRSILAIAQQKRFRSIARDLTSRAPKRERPLEQRRRGRGTLKISALDRSNVVLA